MGNTKRRTAFQAASLLLLLALATASRGDVVIAGSVSGTSADGGSINITFTCSGSPTCTGTYTNYERITECPNFHTFTDAFSMMVPDLSHPGPIAGSFTLNNVDAHAGNPAPGQPCPYTPGTNGPQSIPYTGTWNGSSASIAIQGSDSSGMTFTLPGTFTATGVVAPPVFPMTVTANVNATTSSASAVIQPKPQDIGTQQSVYVFAHAPSSLVAHAGTKAVGSAPPVAATNDDAVVCVLVQIGPNGQLTAVSASTMQAYLTGVISSQGQAVQLLNSVATANIAGATVFVGYGPSAASMLSNGVYQGALTVPGAVQCTASLASAPAPTSPSALSGLWWNASESGWGIHFTQRGKNLFAAWYTYDTAGNPKWYVAPNCAFANADATSGSCSSAIYEVDGPTFFGTAFNPGLVHATQDGTLTLTFQDTNDTSFTYTLGAFTRTVSLVRQVFPVAQSPTPAVDYTDLWWNSDESGWGMAITHQFGNIFLAWYVYDSSGKPVWYVAPACTVQGSSCSGTLYSTTGPAFGPPLDPTRVQATAVGTALVSFIDANNAVLSYTVGAVSGTKAIKRQLF